MLCGVGDVTGGGAVEQNFNACWSEKRKVLYSYLLLSSLLYLFHSVIIICCTCLVVLLLLLSLSTMESLFIWSVIYHL